MDIRSPETIAIAGLLFAAVAISVSGVKPYGPKPEAAASATAPDACKAFPKGAVASLVGQPVVETQSLPGLGGPDCDYSLASHSDLLVMWKPGGWAQESAVDQKEGAVALNGVGAPAMWIPAENAVEAQAPSGRILFVGLWGDARAPAPQDNEQLATRVTKAALAYGAGPQ